MHGFELYEEPKSAAAINHAWRTQECRVSRPDIL